MSKIDLRIYKRDLREKYKGFRRDMLPEIKAERDHRIARRLMSLYQYRDSSLILIYMSTKIEVDTRELIQSAWRDGKKVAVPRCVDGTRHMDFYIIRSFDDLERHTFGVLEPVPSRCEKLRDFSRSLCIVPALAYDKEGFRLGYGAGYYDRFLAKYRGPKAGIVYADCVRQQLPRGRFDVPVDFIVTERYWRKTPTYGRSRLPHGRQENYKNNPRLT